MYICVLSAHMYVASSSGSPVFLCSTERLGIGPGDEAVCTLCMVRVCTLDMLTDVQLIAINRVL